MNHWRLQGLDAVDRGKELISDLIKIAHALAWLEAQEENIQQGRDSLYELINSYLSQIVAQGELHIPLEADILDCVIELESFSDRDIRAKRPTETPEEILLQLTNLQEKI